MQFSVLLIHVCKYLVMTYVDIDIISNAYREFFNDFDITKSNISRLLKGKIFNVSMRSKHTTSKKLFSFNCLNKILLL